MQTHLDSVSGGDKESAMIGLTNPTDSQYEDDPAQQQEPSGSVKRRRVETRNCPKEKQLIDNYFIDIFDKNAEPVFSETQFRCRYRMHRDLFMKIALDLEYHDDYFKEKRDATGLLGVSVWRKLIAALKLLAYGTNASQDGAELDDSTAMECLERFCRDIIEIHGEEYLRAPTQQDLDRILAASKEREYPGMIGTVDILQWQWEKCPAVWLDAFKDKDQKPSASLEAVATQDLWIWQSHYNVPNSIDGSNAIDPSPVLGNVTTASKIPNVPVYEMYQVAHNRPYYLGDDNYPHCASIIKKIKGASLPRGPERFNQKHEVAGRDVERSITVLLQRFKILSQPVESWKEEELRLVMTACIIVHNMIIEDERDDRLHNPHDYNVHHDYNHRYYSEKDLNPVLPQRFPEHLHRFFSTTNEEAYVRLQDDLRQHQWMCVGNYILGPNGNAVDLHLY